MMPNFIPVNVPLLNGNEARYLQECASSGWVSSEGPFVKEFEKKFAARVSRSYGISVCNGSAALDIAVAALDIGPGDEVILPAFTIISCAASIVRAGATPVLVDVDPHTWNMDVDQIEAKITSRTKAIMVVHIYGLPVDMAPVLAIVERTGLKLIEDAAEAHGLEYGGKPCGSFGDISVFSFYANKLITTGEGGMVLTNDNRLAARCRSLRNLCFKPTKRFEHDHLGWNYRLSNLQAAVGLAQLERIDEFIDRKRQIGGLYQDLLQGIEGIQLPLTEIPQARNVYWVFGLVLDEALPDDAEDIRQRLARRQIGTRPFFWPLHKQPVLRKMGLFKDEALTVSERLGCRGLYLPSGLGIHDDDIHTVAQALVDIFQTNTE
jgi:perosamine synthetase